MATLLAPDPAMIESPGHARRVVVVLLLTWFLANSLTHAVVAALTGRISYHHPLHALLAAEASISLLNFSCRFWPFAACCASRRRLRPRSAGPGPVGGSR